MMPLRKARKIFVDVAIPRSRRKKLHVAYDPETEKIIRVESLKKLIEYGYSEIYLDALLTGIGEELSWLLQNNTSVYILNDPQMLELKRNILSLRKSDTNDAVVLSLLPLSEFRELTIDRLSLEMSIAKYRKLTRLIKILKTWVTNRELGNDLAKEVNVILSRLKSCKKTVAWEIVKRVESDPLYGKVYRRTLERLGMKNSPVLAILLAKLPLHLSVQKLKVHLGFTPNSKRMRKYDHGLRSFLSSLAESVYRQKRYKREKDPIFNESGSKRKALYKLQLKILKTLKRIYREVGVDRSRGSTSL